MCGIICVFGCADKNTSKEKVLDRARRIRHRGPDSSGTYVNNNVIMQHERLSIVDPETGVQPFLNSDKTLVLVVNGEIYNHQQIKSELKNNKWITKSDCECILHLYAEYGINAVKEFLNKLQGMFAFALYDIVNDIYLISRDHLGIIPLYYGYDDSGAIWISSEMKGLHDACVTFKEFPPGHVYISNTKELIKWYNPQWQVVNYIPDTPVDISILREAMIKVVKSHLMTDVPYGVLLSGGLDSSIVAAIAAKQSANLHSFCIGLEGSPDLKAAQKVATHIGTIHHSFKFTVEEGLNVLSDVIYHLETYDTTTIRASTPMYLLARKIKSYGIKMVLSGEGADEAFGGYLYFHKAPNKEEFQKELVDKLKSLHYFDCLRANKSMSAWGVEPRVPFLDKVFLDTVMEIDPANKMCGNNKIEKWILRKAFEDMLPEDIVWRQKEQFSDGVGYSWIDGIKDHTDTCITDKQMKAAKYRFPINTPSTKESYYYRELFEKHYPERCAINTVPGGKSIACSTERALDWDTEFSKLADCSGRAVMDIHGSALDKDERKKEIKRVITDN